MENEHNELYSDITLLNMKQVMRYLNISQWLYYRLVNSGELPRVPLGKRRLVRLKTVREYLEKRETGKAVAYGGECSF
ncbi:MAG: helix-turn-helix domain-containing protein [Oscillospiraceae bacterium]|jgi:excisionase family DNA binding protein|nr:helix-turn-helix domain-containing protein [Oscillospiraceae bacterium]